MKLYKILSTLGLLFIFGVIVLAPDAMAYNLKVTNVSLYRSAAQPAGTIGVKFDLEWDGSFSSIDDNGKVFFDRAWVFVKFFDDSWNADTAWKHATLISGGTVNNYDTTNGAGITSDLKGAFCKPGKNQVVYWNYSYGTDGTDGLSGTESVKVKVFAVEMVYVPQGAFYVGSGGKAFDEEYRDLGSFTEGIWRTGPTIPFKVTTEGAINMGPEEGKLWMTSDASTAYAIDSECELPATFPKGYDGFYMMKYEISQGQYRDFLNTLTRAQQLSYVTATSWTASQYCMANSTTAANAGSGNNYRNGIRVPASVPGSGPLTFGCDYDNNGTFNEATDGEWLPCNYLSWKELYAYMDWAALRPMTELEFEKACRGPRNPVPLEYAWGTTTINTLNYDANTLVSPGTADEGIIAAKYSTTLGNASQPRSTSYQYYTYNNIVRCGIYAANSASTGRITAGASYYGIMELSGNLWERAVTVGTAEGRVFEGSHGDGSVATANLDWPSASDAKGSGFRGGCFYYNNSNNYYDALRVSYRGSASSNDTTGAYRYGGRAVRTED